MIHATFIEYKIFNAQKNHYTGIETLSTIIFHTKAEISVKEAEEIIEKAYTEYHEEFEDGIYQIHSFTIKEIRSMISDERFIIEIY